MLSSIFKIFICIQLYKYSVRCQTCNSFNNVNIRVVQQKGQPFNTVINGCIQSGAFDEGSVIIEAYITEQNIPILGRDSVVDMPRLTYLNFYKCNINEIEPGAFRNLPRLWNIQILSTELTVIKNGVFNSLPLLETIKIHNNLVDRIETDAFGYIGSLKKLYLTHNKLESFDRHWFTNSTSIEIMDLSYNSIKSIEKKSFKMLHKIRELYLDYNEISILDINCFKGLKRLEYLGLRHNRLTSIPANVFANIVRISTMYIDANYLNYLPQELMNKLTVKKLVLDGNPWLCPCLERVNDWLYRLKATTKISDKCGDKEMPVCYSKSIGDKSCPEREDDEATRNYINSVRQMSLNQYCARLD